MEKLRVMLNGPAKCLPVADSIHSPGGIHTFWLASWLAASTGEVIGATIMLSPNIYSFFCVYASSASGQL